MFRQSMNMAPHRYVMRRMVKAQELICRAARPLTDIAMACGFQLRQPFQQPGESATGLTLRSYVRRSADSRAKLTPPSTSPQNAEPIPAKGHAAGGDQKRHPAASRSFS